MNDDFDYLQADFDPVTLTIPKLRGIFVAHEISFNSSAKKGELVDIFVTKLKPLAPQILKKREKIVRTSHGIENAESSTANSDKEEEEEDAKPVKKSRGRPKKTERATEGLDEINQSRTSRQKSKPRTEKINTHPTSMSPTDPTFTSDDFKTPAPKHWGKTQEFRNEYADGDESPFSAENPFQSGSSPPPTTVSKRRKTDGPVAPRVTTIDAKRENISRRKTDDSKFARRNSAKINIPVLAVRHSDQLEAGEEFEESEQAELEEEQSNGKVAVLPVKRSKKSQSSGTLSTILKGCVGALAIVGLGVYRQDKINVGYCDFGHHSELISNLNLPACVEKSILPTCDPCPPNAECRFGYRADCHKNYVLSRNPLSLGGLIPMAATCEPDGATEKREKTVGNRIIKGLNIRNAEYSCSGTDGQGKAVESPELSEDQIWQGIKSASKKHMNEKELSQIFTSSISNVALHEDISVTERDGQRFFRSSSTEQFPFQCSIRKSLVRTLARYFKYVIGFLIIAGLFYGSFQRVKWWLRLRSEAQRYAKHVFHALSSSDQEYLSVNRLRDVLLRDEFSSAKKKNIWRAVEKLVEGNANVSTKFRTTDSGRGWKWVSAGQGSHSSQRHNVGVERIAKEQHNAGSEMSEVKTRRDDEAPIY